MRVVSLQGNAFDLDQVASTRIDAANIVLTFRNGSQIDLHWRDGSERTAVFTMLELFDGGGRSEAHL